MSDDRCRRPEDNRSHSVIWHPSAGKRSTRPNGDMFGRVWGSARGWKGGGRADLTLGPLIAVFGYWSRQVADRFTGIVKLFFAREVRYLGLQPGARGGTGNGQ